MPYLVEFAPYRSAQMSWDDYWDPDFKPQSLDIPYTRTIYVADEKVNPDYIARAHVNELIETLRWIKNSTQELRDQNRSSLYHSFKIAKKNSTKMRQIDQPCAELANWTRVFSNFLTGNDRLPTHDTANILYHTSAFAYVPGRSNVNGAEWHAQTGDYWYAHFDFSNFFGSITPEFAYDMLSRVFPMSEVCKREPQLVKDVLDLCFYRGGLPQGLPISPILTNILMIPLDAALAKRCRIANRHYSRYADDMTISAYHKFDLREAERDILEVLQMFHAPMQLNPEKTTFRNRSAGNVKVYGVRITKDSRCSIGTKNRERFRAMVNSFMLDWLSGNRWNVEDTQHMMGLYAYYRCIDTTDMQTLIKKYETKYHLNFKEMCRTIVREG